MVLSVYNLRGNIQVTKKGRNDRTKLLPTADYNLSYYVSIPDSLINHTDKLFTRKKNQIPSIFYSFYLF